MEGRVPCLRDTIISQFALIGGSQEVCRRWKPAVSSQRPCARHSMQACAQDASEAGSREQVRVGASTTARVHNIHPVFATKAARMRVSQTPLLLPRSRSRGLGWKTSEHCQCQEYRWSRQRGITCSHKASKASDALTHRDEAQVKMRSPQIAVNRLNRVHPSAAKKADAKVSFNGHTQSPNTITHPDWQANSDVNLGSLLGRGE